MSINHDSPIKNPVPVNILIPTYNQASLVGEAIESALAQDYPHKSIIISDDGSVDETPKVLAEFAHDPSIRVFRNEQNLGRIGNYRKLLYEYADAEWALNLDGDDKLLDPGMISSYMKALEQHHTAVFCTSRQWYGRIGRQKRAKSVEKMHAISGSKYFFEHYANYNFNHQTSLYNVALAKKVEFYSSEIISSDAESFLKLAWEGDVLYRKKKSALWRAHANNVSTVGDIDVKVINAQTLVENLTTYVTNRFPQHQSKLKAWRRRVMMEYAVPMFFRTLKQGDWSGLKRLMKRMGKFDAKMILSSAPLHYLARRSRRYVENLFLAVGS
ncbi:MAG: glycosyltransferase family 2 protein [Saprospiraceae bacterium]|nr:glycosyltransferase family 2 protein [Saprospiraceae bacterium]